ncbi:coiled-coil domain-containing protein 9B isoform X4 [Trematomus bernacchii]|uniref:coiled-coil domain-containing protein 9B isoform X4 n=1 Tax=Trematomus bernacchii TaxID=40690 RepID=UPI00146BCE5E|nr:coiled-coil domain-containing protein 9B isoform X4 [Trematomus bernacchii]
MERPPSSDMMPKRDHERDLELDRKIEALRRKNAALMKRHKEVEEDRKRAEEEGVMLQSRKGKAEDFTITISKTTNQDSRVVVKKPFSGGSPAGKGQEEAGPDMGEEGPPQGPSRGHRKQLMVTMAGKKGKRVVSERPEKRPGSADVKSPADDGQMRRVESSGRVKHPPHMTKRDTAAQDEVKQGQKHAEEHQRLSEQCQEPESLQASTDLNIPTSKEEQEGYARWKREREQIDKERVARHKNAKGQWRRAWDLDKTDYMLSDKSIPDWGPSSRGGRNARGRGQSRAGHEKRGKDKGAKNVQVISSKAKGIERLTGRARRWQANEDGEDLQSADTTLEEFLEELDALTDADVEDQKDVDLKMKPSQSPDSLRTSEEVSGSTTTVTEDTPPDDMADTSSPQGLEKKVRFSKELIQGSHTNQTTGSQDSACSESRGASSLKDSSPKKQQHQVQGPQRPLESAKQDVDQEGVSSAPPIAQQQASEIKCGEKDSGPSTAPSSISAEKDSASRQEISVQSIELAKCNISNTNTEELIDSGLSVLSLESGETHPTHSTSSDKAREHGKIV